MFQNGSIDCDILFNHLRQSGCTTAMNHTPPTTTVEESSGYQGNSLSETSTSKLKLTEDDGKVQLEQIVDCEAEKSKTENETQVLIPSSSRSATETQHLSYDEDREEDECKLSSGFNSLFFFQIYVRIALCMVFSGSGYAAQKCDHSSSLSNKNWIRPHYNYFAHSNFGKAEFVGDVRRLLCQPAVCQQVSRSLVSVVEMLFLVGAFMNFHGIVRCSVA